MFDSYKLITLPVDEGDLFDDNTVRGISICNGLICFVKFIDTILLWNPTIPKLLTLPQPTLIPLVEDTLGCEYTVTFWFDSHTNDYKVIRFICCEVLKTIEPPQVDIFSLNNNSWKIISQIAPPFEIFGPSIPILNGTLNWIGYDDSEYRWSEVFQINYLPNVLKVIYINSTLAMHKEASIAICCHYYVDKVMEVRVMKEYGDVESWTKIWKCDVSHQPLHAITLLNDRHVIGLLNNGEVLWEVSVCGNQNADVVYKAIISTDPKSGVVKGHVVVPDTYYNKDIIYFEESLVLLYNASAINMLDDNDDE